MTVEPIEVNGLTYAYPDGRAAINDVSLSLRAGESLGIIGPNGAGKTTLFLLIAGLLSPQHGSIRVLGKSYESGNGRDIRRHIGFVFQETEDQLFSPTVYDDVAFGPVNFGFAREEVAESVGYALDVVGLAGFDDRVPHHLASGERRRVALATVLSYHPDLLILDEPTSDLDPRGRRELVERLTDTSQARLVASHDLEFILLTCERVLVIDDGRIVESGPTVDILTNADLLETHGLACPLAWKGLGREAIQRLIETVKTRREG